MWPVGRSAALEGSPLTTRSAPQPTCGSTPRGRTAGSPTPRVRAYAKNHNLGLEVPYRYGSETRLYLPDFIGLVDGHGEADPLHLVVEIKGYRRVPG